MGDELGRSRRGDACLPDPPREPTEDPADRAGHHTGQDDDPEWIETHRKDGESAVGRA